MGEIKASPARIAELGDTYIAMSRELFDVVGELKNIRSNMDWEVRSKNNIDEEFRRLIRELEDSAEHIKELGQYLKEAAETFEACEEDVLAMINELPTFEDELKDMMESFQPFIGIGGAGWSASAVDKRKSQLIPYYQTDLENPLYLRGTSRAGFEYLGYNWEALQGNGLNSGCYYPAAGEAYYRKLAQEKNNQVTVPGGLKYEPEGWNDGNSVRAAICAVIEVISPGYKYRELGRTGEIQYRTNCYAYALDIQVRPTNGKPFNVGGLQVGLPARARIQQEIEALKVEYNALKLDGETNENRTIEEMEICERIKMLEKEQKEINRMIKEEEFFEKGEVGKEALKTLMIKDGKELGYDVIPVDKTTTPPPGSHLIAAGIRPQTENQDGDYHFMRLDSDGSWSHKPGIGDATDKKWGVFDIDNPQNELKESGYTEFVGYYYIVPHQQQGE